MTTPLSDEELAAIRQRVTGIEPGWIVSHKTSIQNNEFISIGVPGHLSSAYVWDFSKRGEKSEALAEFLAAASTDIPRLLDEIDRLRNSGSGDLFASFSPAVQASVVLLAGVAAWIREKPAGRIPWEAPHFSGCGIARTVYWAHLAAVVAAVLQACSPSLRAGTQPSTPVDPPPSERELFEKWAVDAGYDVAKTMSGTGNYRQYKTNWVWRAWCAAKGIEVTHDAG